MIKKIDKLILKAYYGPFFLIYGIVLFIFLIQYMIKNFKHFVGKDLGLDVFAELFFYFSVVLTPVSLPLSVLLSALMTFGSLGEHSELTAIKGSGISLLRILRPATFFILFVTVGALFFNNYIVTWANLQAYSLLYDIKQKKPTLDFKEGVFYNGIPGFSIKVNEKGEDGMTIGDVMIYDHSIRRGNTRVILAEKGKMEMIRDDRFLALTLENGSSFIDQAAEKRRNTSKSEFLRNDFKKSQMLFDLSSFDIKDTKEDLFKGHNMMKKRSQLHSEFDSVSAKYNNYYYNVKDQIFNNFKYLENPYDTSTVSKTAKKDFKKPKSQVSKKIDEVKQKKTPGRLNKRPQTNSKIIPQHQQRMNKKKKVDPLIEAKRAKDKEMRFANGKALAKAESVDGIIKTNKRRLDNQRRSIAALKVAIHQRWTDGIAVFVMFLIGAPLGAIIKKGGLGVPVLISIIFFVIYYITTITGVKMAKEEVISPFMGTWASNIVLTVIGLFFLNQARKDARIFDIDVYIMAFQRVKSLFIKEKE